MYQRVTGWWTGTCLNRKKNLFIFYFSLFWGGSSWFLSRVEMMMTMIVKWMSDSCFFGQIGLVACRIVDGANTSSILSFKVCPKKREPRWITRIQFFFKKCVFTAPFFATRPIMNLTGMITLMSIIIMLMNGTKWIDNMISAQSIPVHNKLCAYMNFICVHITNLTWFFYADCPTKKNLTK